MGPNGHFLESRRIVQESNEYFESIKINILKLQRRNEHFKIIWTKMN